MVWKRGGTSSEPQKVGKKHSAKCSGKNTRVVWRRTRTRQGLVWKQEVSSEPQKVGKKHSEKCPRSGGKAQELSGGEPDRGWSGKRGPKLAPPSGTESHLKNPKTFLIALKT